MNVKTHCQCGQPIEYDADNAGVEIHCPSCGNKIFLAKITNNIVVNTPSPFTMGFVEWLLIGLGGVLGWCGSYFAQPLPLRFFMSFSEYVMNPSVIFNGETHIGVTIATTGFFGIAIGVISMAVILVIKNIQK